MNVPREKLETSSPVLPRRAFVVAGLSAVTAGSFVTLGMVGGFSRIEQDSFQFTRGLSFAPREEDRLRGFLSGALADERIQVTVLAHTGNAGDGAANLKLSEDRATLVRTMAEDMGIEQERIAANGIGGASLLDRIDGESDRAYQLRLARVEVSLQMRR